jgi:phosphoribosylformylglycinamidine cyclo-ligase
MALTYEASGVRYDDLDPFKRAAQQAARQTANELTRFGIRELPWTRGESAYGFELPGGSILVHVEEGLGTKNLIADACASLGPAAYHAVAVDTVAMIVNDLITIGALPVSTAMHLATGSSDWFKDDRRSAALIAGWLEACQLSRCAWAGGETPTLQGVVEPHTFVLSGSAIGIVREPKRHLITGNLKAGDIIVLLGSSGIHANGLTLARKIVERIPSGYTTLLSDSRTIGDALLTPTRIYVRLIEACQAAGIDIHYAVNMTGHGWRKLMRATPPFTYMIDQLPPVPVELDFLRHAGPVDLAECYGTWNMGAGFALMVPPEHVQLTLNAAGACRIPAWVAGRVLQGDRKVSIAPLGIEFRSESLAIR